LIKGLKQRLHDKHDAATEEKDKAGHQQDIDKVAKLHEMVCELASVGGGDVPPECKQ
jgi:hypothetical protein